MAKILYSVCGDGSGHATRSLEIIKRLKFEGHDLKVVSFDTGYEYLSKHFLVEQISGLRLKYKDNQIKYFQTVVGSALKMPKYLKSLSKLSTLVDDFQPDLIITDFEPLAAVVAERKELNFISIDNQHLITDFKIDYPEQNWFSALSARKYINCFFSKAKRNLVFSFFSVAVINKKSILIPPIIRSEILTKQPTKGDHILVYLTSFFTGLIDILKEINFQFIVYGLGDRKSEKNIIFKTPDSQGFANDLVSCRAVIANAGFALISESIYLHKPYLACPVKGQFEQILNAYYLEKLGYGDYSESLDREKIIQFLSCSSVYQENYKKRTFQPPEKSLVRVIEEINKELSS